MNALRKLAALSVLIVGLPGGAMAATAVATVDVNVRSGPGPEFPVVDYLQQDAAVELVGCLANSRWCQVRKAETLGWSYGDYLAVTAADGTTVVIGDTWPPAGLPSVAYVPPDGTVYAPPARPLRRLIAPVRKAIPAPRFDPPPAPVQTYVIENRRDPVLLDGEVVVGAAVPDDVELYDVPDYQYRYTYVNQVPVLVQPDTRRVVYIYR